MNDESTIKPQPTSEEINQSSEVKAERRRDRTNVPPGLPGVPAEIPIEERPLSLCDKPYLIDELGIKNLLLKLNPSHLDKKIDIIDAYIKNEITQRKWKPNIKSYVKVFSEIKEKLGVSDDMTPLTQIEKIFDIIEKSWKDKKLQKKIGIKIIPTFSGF